MEPFAFIVYHADISPEGIEAISNIYPEDKQVNWKARWKLFQQDYLPNARLYIETLFHSVRLVHPNCRCYVLTDQDTEFSFSQEIEIKRYPLDPDKPAYNRLLAEKAFLKDADDTFHKVFLDYDMLVQQSLEQIAGFDFDLALTFDANIQRVNGSFIMVRKGGQAAAIRYFEMIEELYSNSYTAYEAWGGISVAMNDLFAINLKTIPYLKTVELAGIKFFILPSEKYNYPISDAEFQFHEYLPDKMILHFKGLRKTNMLEYWNSYLKPKSLK